MLSERLELSPLRVELRRHEPSPSDPFRRYFRAPIRFQAARNALEFAQRDIDAPLPNRNAELSGWVNEVLTRAVAQLDANQIVSRVRSAVLERLPNGEPVQAAIARVLRMPQRTLQRRLAQAGTSYNAFSPRRASPSPGHY